MESSAKGKDYWKVLSHIGYAAWSLLTDVTQQFCSKKKLVFWQRQTSSLYFSGAIVLIPSKLGNNSLSLFPFLLLSLLFRPIEILWLLFFPEENARIGLALRTKPWVSLYSHRPGLREHDTCWDLQQAAMAPPYSAVSFSPWSLPARTLQINKSAETLHNCSFKVNFIVLYLAYVLFLYEKNQAEN